MNRAPILPKTVWNWTVGLLCLLTGGASVLHASKDVPIIGLSMDTLALDRWQKDRDTFVATVESLGGRVIVENANSVDATQIKQIQGLADRKVDVMVIVPHDATALGGVIKSVNSLNIPVVSYDRLILNADVGYYLSFDNVKVGEAQASYVVAHIPTDRRARIVRICGAGTDNNAKMFKQGQDNILSPLIASGKIEIIHEGWAADWKPEEAQRIMHEALAKAGPGAIDAILASNDATAGGAIEAVTESGRAPIPCVTGQDADRAACVRIKMGSQSMTVYKPLPKLAIHAAQIAVEIARGTPPKTTTTLDNGLKAIPAIFEDIVSVDRLNIDSTVVSDGFLRAKK